MRELGRDDRRGGGWESRDRRDGDRRDAGRRGDSRDRGPYDHHRDLREDRGDFRAREPERFDGRDDLRRNNSRDNDRRDDDRRRNDEDAGRGSGGRRMPYFSESDSSETEYTRQAVQWEVRLNPHQQLEALDLWLKANPEVARDVDMINNRAKGLTNKPPPNFQEGDWMCETCKQHNWRNRMDCRGCGAPAPADKIAELQAQKARTAVAQAARAPAQSARPGDWMCVGCTSSNYASKRQCHRCNMPKPHEWVCSVCNSMNVGADHANCSVCMGGGGASHAGFHHHGGAPAGGFGGPGM